MNEETLMKIIAFLLALPFVGYFIYHLGSTEQVHTFGGYGPDYVDKPFELLGDGGGLTQFLAFLIFLCILWFSFAVFNEVSTVFGTRSLNKTRGYGPHIKGSLIVGVILFIIFSFIA